MGSSSDLKYNILYSRVEYIPMFGLDVRASYMCVCVRVCVSGLFQQKDS